MIGRDTAKHVSRSGDLLAKIATCFGANLCGRSDRDKALRFPPSRHELRHHTALTSVALTTDLMKEFGSVVTTVGPSSLKVVSKIVYFGRLSNGLFALWKMTGPQPPPDRLPLDLQRLTDGLLRVSFTV